MASQNNNQYRQFAAGGFELYLPEQPACTTRQGLRVLERTILFDDKNNNFYKVTFTKPAYQNPTNPHTLLDISEMQESAIMFSPLEWIEFQKTGEAVGRIVSVLSNDGSLMTVKSLDFVTVQHLTEESEEWAKARMVEGLNSPSEMEGGLHRLVATSNATEHPIPFIHQIKVARKKSEIWHSDGVELNHDVDHLFASGWLLGGEQQWRLYP